MADKKTFLVPVVIDGTPQRDASVPEKFRHVQWSRLPDGDPSPGFVTRIATLLGRNRVPIGPAAVDLRAANVTARHRTVPAPGYGSGSQHC
jgi:hypothetical protein